MEQEKRAGGAERRRQRFREGQRVQSLRPQDDGCVGVVLRATRKRTGWQYTLMFDGWYRVASRPEAELKEVL